MSEEWSISMKKKTISINDGRDYNSKKCFKIFIP